MGKFEHSVVVVVVVVVPEIARKYFSTTSHLHTFNVE